MDFSWLLNIFGWKPLSKDFVNYMENLNKAILIFPHTTKLDNLTFLPYAKDKSLNGKLWILTKRSVINSWTGSFFFPRFFNAIPVNDNEAVSENLTDKIVNILKTKDKFILCLSPEGSRDKKEWRSGYFHLANLLECPIIVVGFDFCDHEIKLIGSVSISKNQILIDDIDLNSQYHYHLKDNDPNYIKAIVQPILIDMMARIIPLYPKSSYTQIKRPANPSFFDSATYDFYMIIIILIILIVMLLIISKKNKQPKI